MHHKILIIKIIKQKSSYLIKVLYILFKDMIKYWTDVFKLFFLLKSNV